MKSERQQVILDIVNHQEIETQEQLQEQLRERGIVTTQATISRDIKQLHLVKELTRNGLYKYAVSQRPSELNLTGRLKSIFQEGVTIDAAQNLVVLKTMPGMANAVAAAIDSMTIPDLVGSLAGDDTVVLILRDNASADSFCAEMRALLA